eukprot:3658587-Alexandrium_andersonii.AAC.1
MLNGLAALRRTPPILSDIAGCECSLLLGPSQGPSKATQLIQFHPTGGLRNRRDRFGALLGSIAVIIGQRPLDSSKCIAAFQAVCS